jgi:CubicO group peptidase (beta-lactamase class C family)
VKYEQHFLSHDLLIAPVSFPHSRKPMNTLLYLGGLLAMQSLAATASAATAQPTNAASALEAIRKKHDLPALAVIVVKDGKICDRAAVGLRKQGDPAPVTTNDLFHIGSCTKSMTATLAALLVEDGKLQWTTTVAQVFPDLKMDKRYEAVTLEQLLTHRGGCPAAPPTAAWTRAREQKGTATEQRLQFITAVLSQPPAAAPGSQFIYSNQGYAIAGAMLEKLTSKSWELLLTEKLFRPLGMNSAGFGVPGSNGKVEQPWGHTYLLWKASPVQSDNPPAIGPAGTVHCSLDDLARFVMLHLQGGQGAGRLLKPGTFRKLHTPPTGGEYAFGWLSLERGWAGGKALMHNGSNTMWYLVMWLAPEKNFAVIAATNIAGANAEKGCDDAASAMIQKWLGK